MRIPNPAEHDAQVARLVVEYEKGGTSDETFARMVPIAKGYADAFGKGESLAAIEEAQATVVARGTMRYVAVTA